MLAAGKYFIGDLGYVMSDADWDSMCAVSIDGDVCLEGEFKLPDGRVFAMYNTLYGDGVFMDRLARKYPVDSGTIGCILLDAATSLPDTPEELAGLGAVVEFNDTFSTGRSAKGLIHFGSVAIDTDADEDPGEDDEADY